jgi:AraC-like DNA-binding protein
LRQGEVSYSIEDKVYTVRENGIIFTRPGMLHRIDFVNKSVYERHDIIFSERIIFPEMLSKIPANVDVIHIQNYKYIEALFSSMDFYCGNLEGEALENILKHLIDEVVYNVALSKELTYAETETVYSVNPIVTKAVRFIEENLSRDLSLELICNELFITKSYLHKLFNKDLKMSPGKYISSKRLLAAQRLLREGASPTEIFEKMGYSEYSTFYRSYRDYFGYPPSEEKDRIIRRRIDH